MSIDLVRLGKMVLFMTPNAMELLVWVGDCPRVHYISVEIWRRGTISLAVMNRSASSASAAEYMTNFIIWAMVRMGTLCRGLVSSSESDMCAPDRLHCLEILRYAASEWAARRMSMAL